MSVITVLQCLPVQLANANNAEVPDVQQSTGRSAYKTRPSDELLELRTLTRPIGEQWANRLHSKMRDAFSRGRGNIC